jgi:hypothetical protein
MPSKSDPKTSLPLDFPSNHPLAVTHNSGIATWLGNYKAEKSK